MRLTLVISSLRGGGSERVITHLANGWAARGNDVRILTFDVNGPTAFELHEKITRHDVQAHSVIPPVRVWDRVLALRERLREGAPDAVISFGDKTNVQALLAARGSRIPILVSERSDPRMWRIPRGWRLLQRWAYPSADALIVPTRAVQNWARRKFPTLPVDVVPNPIVSTPASPVRREKVVLAAGRLIPLKGFDDLLRAFAGLDARFHDWRLEICGEGPERESLRQLAQHLGIAHRFRLRGFVADMAPALAAASMFVLSSKFEGFPNVLLEAMAQGTPVISTNCRSGPAEIIHDGVDGRLVKLGDEAAMTAAMTELACSQDLRVRLGAAAAESAERRFRLTHVLDLWEEAIHKCLERRAERSVRVKWRAAA